jgi:hypothetical protein
VVGEAMVDAYRLERCVAKQPRVAVSPRILDNEGVFVDVDGTRCLDFFTELMLTAEHTHSDAVAWARTTRANIETSIEALAKVDATMKPLNGGIFETGFAAELEIAGLAGASNLEQTPSNVMPPSVLALRDHDRGSHYRLHRRFTFRLQPSGVLPGSRTLIERSAFCDRRRD